MALSFPELVCLLLLTLPGLCATAAYHESHYRRAATDEVSVLKESLKAMDAELQKTKTELLGTKTELQGTEMELEGRKAELRQLRASLNSVGKRDACQNVSSHEIPNNPCFETCTKLKNCKPVAAPVIAECAGDEWIVFQRRKNGSVNFDRNWEDYKRGFGDPDGGFWLGLNYLHQMTTVGMWKLRVDLSLWNGKTAYATYSDFKVGPESDGYRLHLGRFTGGNAGDSLSHHKGLRFSTPEVDNDLATFSCGARYHGAWWYKSCYYSNLNGLYYGSDYHGAITAGIRWLTMSYKVMKFTEMKIKRM